MPILDNYLTSLDYFNNEVSFYATFETVESKKMPKKHPKQKTKK